mmetsp:Transcript_36746/g.86160  ORF Transcript_36746/g.86160 Transcript_36746/m.86160 type:complete len:488 (-) Transcript_36746:125-1588(-)
MQAMQLRPYLGVLFIALTLAPTVSGDTIVESHCLSLVSQAKEGKHFTVDAILPICEEEVKHGNCAFIAEALSGSMSQPSFTGKNFCLQLDAAQFCSDTMDDLLTSHPVEDLAYGQCLRANRKDDAYCRRFQRMFREAVESRDLDTLRACFKIEAAHNSTEGQPKEEEAPPMTARIIAGGSQGLTKAGDGKAAVADFPKPSPEEDAGAKRPLTPNKTDAERSAPPQNATAATSTKGPIVVEPVPAPPPPQKPAPEAKKAKEEETIIVDPIPAPTRNETQAKMGPIIVAPIPAGNASFDSGPAEAAAAAQNKSAKKHVFKDAEPPPFIRPAVPGGGGIIMEPGGQPLEMKEEAGSPKSISAEPAPAATKLFASPAQAVATKASVSRLDVVNVPVAATAQKLPEASTLIIPLIHSSESAASTPPAQQSNGSSPVFVRGAAQNLKAAVLPLRSTGLTESYAKVAQKPQVMSTKSKHENKAEYNGFLAKFVQ